MNPNLAHMIDKRKPKSPAEHHTDNAEARKHELFAKMAKRDFEPRKPEPAIGTDPVSLQQWLASLSPRDRERLIDHLLEQQPREPSTDRTGQNLKSPRKPNAKRR